MVLQDIKMGETVERREASKVSMKQDLNGIRATLLGAVLVAAGCTGAREESKLSEAPKPGSDAMKENAASTEKITLSDAEWKAKLTPEQYRILRRKGTERAFTGKYWDTKEKGTYVCAACGLELFDSKTKFDSGTGWPSFWAPLSERSVSTEEDRSLFSTRTEVLCARCDSHLGHVFEDGPPPTGLRYCMNSVALELKEEAREKGGKGEPGAR
jgi:peptide-methionine (R)-S-oxide reductase